MVSTQAFAQSADYSSIEAVAGTPAQINYHAAAGKNCTPAPLPAIHRRMHPPQDEAG
jgi:hypothetical protein